MSHALRHEPWLYELELDEEGWVSVEALLAILRTIKKEWTNLSEVDLAKMIQQSSKKRHEIKAGKIRALYGHSTSQKLLKEAVEPPEILYHGTTPEFALIIATEGLKPMGRQYVHLSSDVETARQVGERKSKKTVILLIKARHAYQSKIKFYRGNEHVWLADYILPEFVAVI